MNAAEILCVVGILALVGAVALFIRDCIRNEG